MQSVFGFIALVTSFIGLLPQSYKAYRTRSTRDISMWMLMNGLFCSLAWIVYGTYVNSSFVVYSNVIGVLSCLLLIFQKRHYDHADR